MEEYKKAQHEKWKSQKDQQVEIELKSITSSKTEDVQKKSATTETTSLRRRKKKKPSRKPPKSPQQNATNVSTSQTSNPIEKEFALMDAENQKTLKTVKEILLDDSMEVAKYCCGCQLVFIGVVVFLGIILMIAFLCDSINMVYYDEWGLNYSKLTKTVEDRVYPPGRYALGVGHYFLKFPRFAKSIDITSNPAAREKSIRIHTKDAMPISLEINWQYKLNPDGLLDLFRMFGTNIEDMIVRVGKTAIREVTTNYTTKDFFSKRNEIGANMLLKMRSLINNITQGGIEILYFQMQDVHVTENYENTVTDAEIMHQKSELAVRRQRYHELQKEIVKMQQEYAKQSKIIMQTAESEGKKLVAQAKKLSIEIESEAEKEAYEKLAASLGLTTYETAIYRYIQQVRENGIADQLIINLNSPYIVDISNNTN